MNASLAAHWLQRDEEVSQTAAHHDEAVHARLARIKVDRVKRQAEALRDRWPTDTNVLEQLLLKARFNDERRDDDHDG